MSYKTDKYYWTRHVRVKMLYYQLSEQRVKRVLRNPQRTEEGITPDTVAVMQKAGSKKHPYEIWVMFQIVGEQRRIISAWRYPGITKVGTPVVIPNDVLEDLREWKAPTPV